MTANALENTQPWQTRQTSLAVHLITSLNLGKLTLMIRIFSNIWDHCPCVMTLKKQCPSSTIRQPLTKYVFPCLCCFPFCVSLCFQTWYELVCRSKSANFRCWKWNPHFRGTNSGAMLTKEGGVSGSTNHQTFVTSVFKITVSVKEASKGVSWI